ncbi:MAG: hypothetical protein E2O54_07655 [Gammaproteobacteria bacterium]|nr:MAG: hypothetical protein E2O54_07655 [Gammaproteobacteria bacterium]
MSADTPTDTPEYDSAKIHDKVYSIEETEAHRHQMDQRLRRQPPVAVVPAPRQSPFIELDEMQQLASSSTPIVARYLEADATTLLYGAKDVFKSFVALDWACCVATGTPWQGFPVTQGLVIYVAGEGKQGLWKRVKAWSVVNNVPMDEIQKNLKFTRYPMQVLNDLEMMQWSVDFDVAGWGAEPALVVIDTLATNFGKGDENSPTDCSRFLASLNRHLRSKYQCAVLVVHHAGKKIDLGARGGSSLTSDSDTVLKLKREKTPDHEDWERVTLYCDHIKDGEKPSPFTMQRRIVEIDIGDADRPAATSLVLKRFMTEHEIMVRSLTNDGRSQRQIAAEMGVGRNQVARLQKRLRDWNLIGSPSVSTSTKIGTSASVSSENPETPATPHVH